MPARLALKVDVDTDRGTREGVPALLEDLARHDIRATFLFSLGPDQTGRAITRVFRPGFLSKVSRTSVVSMYGVRTLLNGTLLPAPHIGNRNSGVLREVKGLGHEVGIHCFNHYRWQDHVHRMKPDAIRAEFEAARAEFRRLFDVEAACAGAPGWQSNTRSRQVYDESGLLYSSDTRGTHPFFPRIGRRTFSTLEIPTTLPTFDELMGRPEFPDTQIPAHYLSLLDCCAPNVMTIHAEIEGMGRRGLFGELLSRLVASGVEFVTLEELAHEALAEKAAVPVCVQTEGAIDGRSGTLAVQGPAVETSIA